MPAIRPGLRLRRSRKGVSAFARPSAHEDRLSDLSAVADNPGNLAARCYVPKGASGPLPLVVVLHGCTQNAAVYDHGSGWSRLADRHGFALLFPEQRRANNPLLCFNWFAANDSQRGMGEPASIRAMVKAMAATHDIDPERIFVTGLSAGGAMTAVMLATYPEIFAAGAIIAGVAYGCANDVAEAFDCMGGRGQGDPRELGTRVRRAAPHKGPWPRLQVWQGTADRTVVASNASALVLQWTDLHGLAAQPDRTDEVAGHPRRVWIDADGVPVIELYEIAGMAHGIPLDPGTGEGQSGEAGAYMLDIGLSSTDRIAEFFGIAPASGTKATRATPNALAATPTPSRSQARSAKRLPERATTPAQGIQKAIEDALRAAGLMK